LDLSVALCKGWKLASTENKEIKLNSNEMDWTLIIAFGAVAISTFGLLNRLFDKSLSIREHDEFRKGVEAAIAGLLTQFRREIDKVEDRLKMIEHSRPTVGELKSTADNFKEQLSEVKNNIRSEHRS
jgi:hypothetical protein